MSVIFRTLATAAALCASLLAGTPLAALDKYEINPGAFAKIDEHGVCRVVGNTNANRIMIPTKVAAEWAIGPNAFLRNIAPKISIDTCVPIVLSGKAWGRPGPVGSTGYPTRVPGSGGPVTLTSVGAAVGGGTASLVGNEIHYDPGSAFYGLFYLETRTVTIPWSGIDQYDLPVSGTASITIKGFWEGIESYGYATNNPTAATNTTLLAIDGTTPFPDSAELSAIRVRSGTFDGDMTVDGITVIQHGLNWAIVIDNTVAARSTYTLGPSAGNPNGDGYSNTMLDAQINAAVDFVNALYDWAVEGRAGKSIGKTDPVGGAMTVSAFNTGQASVSVNIYTMNSNMQLHTSGTLSSLTSSRDTLVTNIKTIRHTTDTNAKVNTALTTFNNSSIAGLYGNAISFLNVIVLSPGISDGVSFTNILASIDGTTAPQWGAQVFAFRSGASNAVINELDSTKTARPLNAATAIRNAGIQFPIYLEEYSMVFLDPATSTWSAFTNPNTATPYFPVYTVSSSPISGFFSHRAGITERPSFVCRTITCGAPDVTPTYVTGKKSFDGRLDVRNDFAFRWHYRMRPGYRMQNGKFASDYNTSGERTKILYFQIWGYYTDVIP